MNHVKSYPNARDCEHGRQRGKCVDCDFADADRELDAIALIPEVDAAPDAGVEAVRNAIERLKRDAESRIAAAVAEERERWEARDRLFFAKLSAAGISHGATAEGIIEAFNSGLVVETVAEEREACAVAAETCDPDPFDEHDFWRRAGRAEAAAAIRARGGK